MSWIDVVALACFLPAIAGRLGWLSPTRLGLVFYYTNVISELLLKRAGLPRGIPGLIMVAAGGAGLLLAHRWAQAVGALLAAGLFVLEMALRRKESYILSTAYALPDRRRTRLALAELSAPIPGPMPDPSYHPELTVNLRGPFIRRVPYYDLGDLVVGRTVELTLLVANHSTIPCQLAPKMEVMVTGPLEVETPAGVLPCLRSGEVFEAHVRIRADEIGGVGTVRVELWLADRVQRVFVHCRSVFAREEARAATARIDRYPGGSRAAFAWRGDMDHYDRVTGQSLEGLRAAFELGRRYRFPQTMYMSTRLCLDLEESEAFHKHFGVDRGQAEIPDFIDWMRSEVDIVLAGRYPVTSSKPYCLELGNHGHLHYGTDAAAAPENGWTLGARMGAGRYTWLGDDDSSFAEQRDNVLEARRQMETLLHFTPRSWAMPDRTNDGETAKAMEAAGCFVLSDSNVRARHNVLLQPPPHHPSGTRAVELTKRYPGDPQNIYQVEMLRYWLHRGHRLGFPVVFMCHQHLRQYDGYACGRMTEFILRYVLTAFHGDLYIDTVYGVGRYWLDALSPETRTLSVACDAKGVMVSNRGDTDVSQVPVDVAFSRGREATYLVDLPAGSERRFDPLTSDAA